MLSYRLLPQETGGKIYKNQARFLKFRGFDFLSETFFLFVCLNSSSLSILFFNHPGIAFPSSDSTEGDDTYRQGKIIPVDAIGHAFLFPKLVQGRVHVSCVYMRVCGVF